MPRPAWSFAPVLAPALLLATATATAGDAPLPREVGAGLKAAAGLCTEVGGTPRTRDAVKRTDLNGDGHTDFVLDVGSIQCDGAFGVYGDREKGVTVYVGDGKGGATEAFADAAYGLRLDGGKLWLTLAGGQCGRKPAPDFASESFCERPLAWNATTRKFSYAPVSAVRMIQ